MKQGLTMFYSYRLSPLGERADTQSGKHAIVRESDRMERVLMRIAVASEGLEVAPRFRQCASYMCYRVDRGIIVECQNLPNPGLAAPKLVALLVEIGVDTLIVGAIDYDVANVFCHAGIEVIAGAHGSAREVVQAYLTRTLTGVDELCHLDGWEHEDGHDRDLAEA